ncbi:hypothetical protein GCM10015536_75540 [Streptomyces griseomycini]|nr:hypothetical protein GCM10015536_75540 [Streptomyces griseomycini]
MISRIGTSGPWETDSARAASRMRARLRLRQRVAELEDDLAAARTSLRRMIRNENRA